MRTAALSFAVVIATVVAVGMWAQNTAANAVSSVTIWGSSSPTGLVTHTDTSAVEVGTRFTAVHDGSATAVRFWKLPSQKGLHVGTLWTSTGTKLATTKFSTETVGGWQVANFATPVKLAAGKSYVVSYFAPKGGYADTYNFTGKSLSPDISVAAGSGVYRYGSTSGFPTSTWRSSQYWVDVVLGPKTAASTAGPAPTPSATPKPTAPAVPPKPSATAAPKPTPTPTPTTSASPTPAPTTTPQPTAGFPTASNTGVPAGTTLTAYTGSCTITAANTVIDAKTINCGTLDVRAKGVVISKSVLNGTVYADTDGSGSFTISDTTINIGAQMGTGIGDANFSAIRVHVTGGNRSINCFLNCSVTGSYVHGQFTDKTGVAHESGIRMGSGSTIRGNTIACTAPDVAPDAGCSAALTGYGDFAVVKNNVIDGNLFIGGSGGYCAYGGSTTGKPYSAGVNAIRFTNNVFQRGTSGKCGFYGPITSFDTKAPGNVWSNNTYDNGAVVAAAN